MWKDWVIIIGFLLIILVLADGIRRKRNERNGNIKVSRSLKKSLKQPIEDEDEPPVEAPSYISELPNGGARVVGKRESSAPVPSIEKKAQAKSYLEKHQRQQEAASSTSHSRAQREPQQASLNLGQAVPMLMESVSDSKNQPLPLEDRIEPSFSALDNSDIENDYDDREDDEYEGEDYERDDHPYTRELADDAARDPLIDEESEFEDEQDVSSEEPEEFEDDEYSHEEEYDEYDSEDDYEDDEPHSATAAHNNIAEKQPAEPEEVLIINVMAHKGEMFNGGDLLDIILKCGMRYGSMDIFHRHSDTKGEGALLFSMANMVKPGTFDLDAMDEFETPGVSLFMTLPINADSMQSFDLMADTARAIAETLGGELKDEQRSVMTRQTLEHCRERIRNFERMRLFRRPPPR
ncbi:cell division protein ZipA [Cellvibrio sp. OA-2007]|uniref:cell division protein ZipA n=1 Tax=Cellvibrio sp. OA-2007 TaxID=529823 RepID=UPI000784AB1A|nr:cell division protein ZipA [Cellvibrio sp. OA-2007]